MSEGELVVGETNDGGITPPSFIFRDPLPGTDTNTFASRGVSFQAPWKLLISGRVQKGAG
jgi:hypothetical protein